MHGERKYHFLGSGDMVAKLKSWYALQDASNNWQEDYASLLAEYGHQRGKSNGAVFTVFWWWAMARQ